VQRHQRVVKVPHKHHVLQAGTYSSRSCSAQIHCGAPQQP
jgi:hypothetical protein